MGVSGPPVFLVLRGIRWNTVQVIEERVPHCLVDPVIQLVRRMKTSNTSDCTVCDPALERLRSRWLQQASNLYIAKSFIAEGWFPNFSTLSFQNVLIYL